MSSLMTDVCHQQLNHLQGLAWRQLPGKDQNGVCTEPLPPEAQHLGCDSSEGDAGDGKEASHDESVVPVDVQQYAAGRKDDDQRANAEAEAVFIVRDYRFKVGYQLLLIDCGAGLGPGFSFAQMVRG